MRINNKVRKFLETFYWLGFFVLFLFAITSGSLPIQITFIIVFVIASLTHQINEELKRKDLESTCKNIIDQTKFKLSEFVIGALILALAIYLINLWKSFIFIFLIGGFLYTFKEFRKNETFTTTPISSPRFTYSCKC